VGNKGTKFLKNVLFLACQTRLHFFINKWWKNAIKVRKMPFFMRAKQGLTFSFSFSINYLWV